MNIDRSDTLKKIIYLAKEFYSKANISIDELLKQSGYYELNRPFKKEDIKIALIKNKNAIEDWIRYSEDKRCSYGFYIIKNNDTFWLVGNLETDSTKIEIAFSNKLDAVAYFIEKELECLSN